VSEKQTVYTHIPSFGTVLGLCNVVPAFAVATKDKKMITLIGDCPLVEGRDMYHKTFPLRRLVMIALFVICAVDQAKVIGLAMVLV